MQRLGQNIQLNKFWIGGKDLDSGILSNILSNLFKDSFFEGVNSL